VKRFIIVSDCVKEYGAVRNSHARCEMKKRMKSLSLAVAVLTIMALHACGGNDNGVTPDLDSCPNWSLGDSMTYLRTETVSGVTVTTMVLDVVTERTADSVVLSDGTSTRTYAVAAGKYIPLTEQYTLSVDYGGTLFDYTVTDTYSSATAFCPPPAISEKYVITYFVPGPWEGTGEYLSSATTILSRAIESLSVPAGDFLVTKLVMVGGRAESTVTRYYAGRIGVIKEVKEIPAANTTITKELTAYY